ncbi:MAG: hypothetical protein C4293_03420 [Nitrospiraceae bacterium]
MRVPGVCNCGEFGNSLTDKAKFSTQDDPILQGVAFREDITHRWFSSVIELSLAFHHSTDGRCTFVPLVSLVNHKELFHENNEMPLTHHDGSSWMRSLR